MKKIISVMLSIIMGVLCAAPISAIAATDQTIVEYNKVSRFDEIVIEGLKNFDTTINIAECKVDKDYAYTEFAQLLCKHPDDLFYVSSSFNYDINPDTNKVTNITPKYAIAQSDLTEARAIYEKGMQRAMTQVDDKMTDVQKALVLHDYICNLANYADLSSGNKYIYHSAYSFFYDGQCVCAGYALAYASMLTRLGIINVYVSSENMKHSWNAVYVTGKDGEKHWYNVDITSDDFNPDYGYNFPGLQIHNCFLKSNGAFMSQYCLEHIDMIFPYGITCNKDDYWMSFWDECYSNIYVNNGNYYYVKFDFETASTDIVKRDLAGNETLIQHISSFEDDDIPTYMIEANYSSFLTDYVFDCAIPIGGFVQVNDWFYYGTLELYWIPELSTANHKVGCYMGCINSVNINGENNHFYSRPCKYYYYDDELEGYVGESMFSIGLSENGFSYSTEFDNFEYIEVNRYYGLDDLMNTAVENDQIHDVNSDGFINAKDFAIINRGDSHYTTIGQ